MPDNRRSARKIRLEMADNRARLQEDLIELEDRLDESFNPKRLLSRHPLVTGVAGALIGFVVFRRPALIMKSVTRLAQLGAPFVLKALLQRDGRESSEPS